MKQERTFEQFLNDENISLSAKELHKYSELGPDEKIKGGSLLGWLYTKLFKAPLQEKSLTKGIFTIFKFNSPWEEQLTFAAFEHDHKRFDQLSNYYGNRYRGSFVFNYLMGALAVLAALVPVGFDFVGQFGEHSGQNYATVATVVELVLIIAILRIYKIGETPHSAYKNKFLGKYLGRRWHEKWLEYRLLAERFRYMEILYPLGIDPLKENETKSHSHGWTWMDAYFHYRLSEVKTALCVDKDNIRDRLKAVMVEQKDYHEKNEKRMEHIHHRLHTLATWLFSGTFLACVAHFVFHHTILTLLSGFLPALAAAMHGILASGEFAKTADISERMAEQIGSLIEQLDSAQKDVREVAIDFHNIVIKDVMGWKAIFMDKNVPLA